MAQWINRRMAKSNSPYHLPLHSPTVLNCSHPVRPSSHHHPVYRTLPAVLSAVLSSSLATPSCASLPSQYSVCGEGIRQQRHGRWSLQAQRTHQRTQEAQTSHAVPTHSELVNQELLCSAARSTTGCSLPARSSHPRLGLTTPGFTAHPLQYWIPHLLLRYACCGNGWIGHLCCS
jgi:hypothetical protein